MKKGNEPSRKRNPGVIPLADLVPRKDPKGGSGGSGKTVFGGGSIIPGPHGPDRHTKKGFREKLR
jgi:hypothetical protein